MKTFAGVAVLLLLPTAALAQGNPGPFGGLFGRTPERIGKDYRTFEIRTLVTGQVEDTLTEPVGRHVPVGALGTGGVRGMFEQRSARLTFNATSYVNYLQYFQAPHSGGTSVASTVTTSFRASSRLNLDGAVSHAYTPFFQFHPNFFSWTPQGVLVMPTEPYVATAVKSHAYSAFGGVSVPYSKHSTLNASFERRETQFEQRRYADQTLSGMRGWWTHQLNRDLGLRFGYGREYVEQQADHEYVYETLDIGLNFARPISRDQRTTVNVQTELAREQTPLYGRHFRVNGNAIISRWFGRTGLFEFNAQRATDFVPGFVEPLHSDTLGASLSGMLSRRAQILVQGHAGRGRFGSESLVPVAPSMMAMAMTQFSFAATRKVGVFIQHNLFYFDSPERSSSVAPVTYFARQTMTIGMTTWIPIYTRERTPSDTR